MTTLAQPPQTLSATEMLANLIVNRLLPMFFKLAGGDPQTARAMAIEAVNAHCARNAADLIAVAMVVACGMAALDNAILSVADDISHTIRLRLQGATNALNRTIEQNRRFLQQDPPSRPDACDEPGPEDAAFEAAAIAGLAEARRQLQEAREKLPATSELAVTGAPEPNNPERAEAAQPAVQAAGMPAPPVPSPPTMPPQPTMPQPPMPKPATPAAATPELGITLDATPVPDLTEHEKALIWANSMNRIAAEYTASIPHLPAVKRRQATMRANALSTTASALIARALPQKPGTA